MKIFFQLNLAPDLKVVKWLVRSGADVDDTNDDPMMYLFTSRYANGDDREWVEHPAYAAGEEEHLQTEDHGMIARWL